MTAVLVSATGEPLSVGRARRLVRGSQRRALVLRDGGCVLRGRPPALCDSHHIQSWADGGPTVLSNLCLVCRPCHTRVHEGGWRLVRGVDDTFLALPP